MQRPPAQPLEDFDCRPEGGVGWGALLACLALHVIPLTVLVTGCSIWDWLLGAVLFMVRGFVMAAGYHRYFAHRSYKTSRCFQFLLAAVGCMGFRGGPLYLAALHPHHHRFSDTHDDVHSPAP